MKIADLTSQFTGLALLLLVRCDFRMKTRCQGLFLFSYEPDDALILVDACGPMSYRHFRLQVPPRSLHI